MRKIKALLNGEWNGMLPATAEVRTTLDAGADRFRGVVTADAAGEFPAEPGRYHLYVSYACPWAHRTILYRKLKQIEDVVSMSVLHPRWASPEGWRFEDGDWSTIDHAGGKRFLYEVYRAARPDYTGRVTVPVLWDKKTSTIVNTESGQIIRMFNSAFDEWGNGTVDFYPEPFRSEIDAVNAWVLRDVCAGVYKAGFAADQRAYDIAVRALFSALDALEDRLSTQPYLLGETITESDWHLFTALCRFDAAYYGALRCDYKRLIDYPALRGYTKRLYDHPGVAETVRFDHIRQHYYDDISEINRAIIPIGPSEDFTMSSKREARR